MAKRTSLLLPLLVLLLLVGTGTVAFVMLGGKNRPAQLPEIGGPAVAAGKASQPADERPPAALTRPADKAVAAPVVAAEETTPERREAGEAELAEAHWVSGRVVLPLDVPVDETVEIVAEGKPFANRELHRSTVAGDGTFRVAFSEKTKSGRLKLDAAHLYLDSNPRVRMSRLPDEIVLEPLLGGRITGVVRPPAITDEERELLRETKVTFRGWTQGRKLVGRASGLDEDLRFDLRGVPPQVNSDLFFDAGFLVPVEMDGVGVDPGGTRHIEIELRLGARVSGTLLDENGSVVERATVRAQYERQRPGWTAKENRDGKLDDDGAFSIQGVPAGPVVLVAECQGWADAKLDLDKVADGDALGPFELVMRRGGTIRGTVQWPDERAVVGARVVVSGGEDTQGPSRIDESIAETDADGRFEVTGLTRGPFQLEASARPDWQVLGDSGEDLEDLTPKQLRERKRALKKQPSWRVVVGELEAGAELQLVLTSGLYIEGEVVDDTGTRLDRFTVSARPHDPEQPWNTNFGDGVNRLFRDAGGAYRLDGLHEGMWKVSANAPGFDESAAVIVELPEESGQRLTFTLGRAARLTGVVLRPDGLPAAKARVEIETDRNSPYSFSFNDGDRAGTADEEGRFEIDRVPIGSVEVHADLPGFARSEALELDLRPAEEVTGLRLELRVGGTLTGELLPRAGASAAHRVIQISLRSGGIWESTTTDGDGRFEMRHLVPGTYTLTAPPSTEESQQLLDANGEMDWVMQQAASDEASAEVADGESVHVVIGAPPEDPIRVSGVVTRGASPVEGATVWAWGSRDQKRSVGRTDAKGRYELALDGAGNYSFTASAPAGNTQVSRSEEVEADQVIDFELGSGRIAGRVLGPEGPLSGIDLAVRPERGAAQATYSQTKSDEDGNFSFEDLNAGTYTVETARYWRDSSGWAPASVADLVVTEGGSIEGVELRLERAAEITGRVTAPDGTAAVGATVWYLAADGSPSSSIPTQSDGTGRYTSSGLRPGTWTVRAELDTFVSADSAAVTLAAGGKAEVDLALREGTYMRVFVESEAGEPTGASITIQDSRGRSQPSMRYGDGLNANSTPETGFVYGPFPPGEYTVTAGNQDGYRAEARVRVGGESELPVRLRLAKPEKGS